MPRRLQAGGAEFAAEFRSLLSEKRETADDVNDIVAEIIVSVREQGDRALISHTNRLDRMQLTADDLRIPSARIKAAAAAIPVDQRQALNLAADRITAFHQRQLPADEFITDAAGVGLGHRWSAIGAVGVYVPGGLAAYPSSVLMNLIPAKVAGVERLIMVVPTPDDIINDLVLAAADLAGADEIYRIGGAQAIAALAYGTETVPKVDKIVGPGNAFVAAAKRQVFGQVGIDMIAGPSEILVVADAANDPAWIAADLLSQAEHDRSAQSILICDDAKFADQVEQQVTRQLTTLPKAEIAAASWRDFGAIILVDNLGTEAPVLIDQLAPEHLELAVSEPEAMAEKINNAGAIFLGRHTPEAIGDYIAGSNHVLPTARSARFASGLSVLDFIKRTSLVRCDAASLAVIGPAAITLAEGEGLSAHARSVAIRLNAASDISND